MFLTDYSYDSALIGVTDDGRAVYVYDWMVDWLVEHEGFTAEDAAEWVSYNTVRGIGYMPDGAPIVIYPLVGGRLTEEDKNHDTGAEGN